MGVMTVDAELLKAVHSRDRVMGLTHGLYRYPARFSPQFARTVIERFSEPGDYVLDPFVGGGTAAVEALAAGRRFVGFDLNPLCLLLTQAKTSPLYQRDWQAVERWMGTGGDSAGTGDPSDPRLRNAPPHLVREFGPLVDSIETLAETRQRAVAKALLLHVGQKALDGRAEPMAADAVRPMLVRSANELRHGLEQLSDQSRVHGIVPSSMVRRRVLAQGPSGAVARGRVTNRLAGRIQLVVTSPPYPGVHVLYHRWQVRGRWETPLPYWLSGMQDGLGAKHYTMGSRSETGDETYFATARGTWSALARLLRPGAAVVQLVAFARRDTQLPRYLEVMASAGFDLEGGSDDPDQWRSVPNRKWYFRVAPSRPQAAEVLLVHRKRF